MNKDENIGFSWIVKKCNTNENVIKDYNVLENREDFIRKLKKNHSDREEFAEELRCEMIYHYWAKCQHEITMFFTKTGRIILNPYLGCRLPCEGEIDVTDDTDFDWKGFAESYKKKGYKNNIKIDIWSQIEYRFNDFVDYCWKYK